MVTRMRDETDNNSGVLHIGLPKGRMAAGVEALLRDAGIDLAPTERGYRPSISMPDTEVKVLKPQNLVEMLDLGTRDVGFAGADWVRELDAGVVEVLDTELDRVQVVAAAPPETDPTSGKRLVVATEYTRITRDWVRAKGIDAEIVRSYGATEVFPPEDADLIVDNTATGATLRANRLRVIDVLMESSTRLYASRRALEVPVKRRRIEDLKLLVGSVLDARRRIMLELNVGGEDLARIVELLPCMREATVSPLYGDQGYAVRAAVPRNELPALIPMLKAAGGTDLVVTVLAQIVS
jgi:ATP phosphoribosyltransferase